MKMWNQFYGKFSFIFYHFINKYTDSHTLDGPKLRQRVLVKYDQSLPYSQPHLNTCLSHCERVEMIDSVVVTDGGDGDFDGEKDDEFLS